MNLPDGTPLWLEHLNAFFWIGSNVIIFGLGIILVFFVIVYIAFFDPKATTAGKFILRFILSLIFVVGLVYIGTYIDPVPGRPWNVYPHDIDWWRPAVRFFGYAYCAYSALALMALLFVRKFFPDKIKIAPERFLVKVRSEEPHDKAA